MEDSNRNSILSRKNELRSLFKKCFKNQIFSFVPFEIWRDLIVSNVSLNSIALLSQTCHAFKEIVDDIGENNFNLALMFRREGQIPLAKKYLLKCAENKNRIAMFQLGFCLFWEGGWGFKQNHEKAAFWFEKATELDYGPAIAYYIYYCSKESRELAKKAFDSGNDFARGWCYFKELHVACDLKKAFEFFERSAKEGDEFGQYFTAHCWRYGMHVETNEEKALFWYLKAAEIGSSMAQFACGEMYLYGFGCVENKQKALFWIKKAANQEHFYSCEMLSNEKEYF